MGVECKDWEVLSNWRVILTIYEGSIVSFTGGVGTGTFYSGVPAGRKIKGPVRNDLFRYS